MKNDSLSAIDWLEKAEEDLQIAEDLYARNKFYGDVCFHSQQVAEKSLKGYLIYHREKIKKIHFLEMLVQDCIKYDDSLNKILPLLKKLDKLYIPTRYPFKIEFTAEDAREAIESAKMVLQEIKSRIK